MQVKKHFEENSGSKKTWCKKKKKKMIIIRHALNLLQRKNSSLIKSWLLWQITLSFPLRIRLHNLGATRCSPTEKWDCSQMLQASRFVCRPCFSFFSPTQSVPWEALIMFHNTKVDIKFKDHVSRIQQNSAVYTLAPSIFWEIIKKSYKILTILKIHIMSIQFLKLLSSDI